MAESVARFLPCGDGALSVEFSDRIDAAVNARVIALAADLARQPIPGIEEAVPTYRSLMVIYDPSLVLGQALGVLLAGRIEVLSGAPAPSRCLRVPVVYGGDAGLDLEELARMKDMTAAELIALHAGADYRVYMIGFAPGFAYLGGLPAVLHTPRLATPRQRIEAGAIGIGGRQASVNSVAGPSGWRFIGRTPLRLFDPARPEPFLLKAGDRVTFRAISGEEGAALDAAVADGAAIMDLETA